jgi:hypothetical protein
MESDYEYSEREQQFYQQLIVHNETATQKFRLSSTLLEAENHPFYGIDGESIHAGSTKAGTPVDIIFRIVGSTFSNEWFIALELSELKVTGIPIEVSEVGPAKIFTPKKSKFASFSSPQPTPKRKLEEVRESCTKKKMKTAYSGKKK